MFEVREDKIRVTINLYYTGKNGSARQFMNEMESSGIAKRIGEEPSGDEKFIRK